MKHLYAPWRGNYIANNNSSKKSDTKKCVFCLDSQLNERHFILRQFEYTYVMLNAFPYNPGHLLVVPYEHLASLEDLSKKTRAEMTEVIALSSVLLKQAIHTDGMNIGFNLGGKAAGGSIPEHLHGHVVPRWFGDTNFLAAFAETRQISADLQEIYKKLLPLFQESNLCLD